MSFRYFNLILISFFFLLSSCGGGGGDSLTDSSNGVGQQCYNRQCELIGLERFSEQASEEIGGHSHEVSTRVINGDRCTTRNSPVVQLSIAPPGDFSDSCTGTFINPSTILTAGHCLPQTAEGVFAIYNGEPIPAQDVRIHPGIRIDAESNLIINDVGLVFLSKPVAINTLPIIISKLPEREEKYSIYGYGLNENSVAGIFNSGQMEIVEVGNTHHIGLFEKPCSNTCAGDSGGPSVQVAVNQWGQNAPGIIGVLSSGEDERCGDGDRSAFQTLNIPEVLSWILANAPSAGLI